MADNNDKQIKNLLSVIESQKASLGTKPKPLWKTNGVIDGNNINTINSLEKCVQLTAKLMMESSAFMRACEFLEVDTKESERATYLSEALSDLKLRAEMVRYDIKKKKLQATEKKLKDLRSEDLKTADALTDIASILGV